MARMGYKKWLDRVILYTNKCKMDEFLINRNGANELREMYDEERTPRWTAEYIENMVGDMDYDELMLG